MPDTSARRFGAARARTVVFGAVALAVAALAACSGSSASIGGGDTDGGPPGSNDGGPSSDSAGSADGSSVDEGSVPDSSTVDAGGVHELAPPQCHDLTQHGSLVMPVANANPPPMQVPIATIQPGLYTLVSAIDYDGSTLIQPITTSKTTAVFTATRQYYFSENGNAAGAAPQVLTLDWQIVAGRLIRHILCAQQPAQVGTMVDYRVDSAPNGFIVYVPAQPPDTGRTQAFRYARMN